MHCKLMGRIPVVGSQICYSYKQKNKQFTLVICMIRMFRKSSLQYFYCLIQGLVFMIQLRKENNADILHMNSSFGQCTTRNFNWFL